MGFQLIAGLVMTVLLAGAFLSWKADLRKEGEARAVAEYQEQQKKQDAENLRLAQEGEKEAKRLLLEQQKRNRLQASQLATAALARRTESDLRAKDDREFALWREQPVPDWADARLRSAVQPAASTKDSGFLPGRVDIRPKPNVPAIADRADVERSFTRIFVDPDRSTQGRMVASRTGE